MVDSKNSDLVSHQEVKFPHGFVGGEAGVGGEVGQVVVDGVLVVNGGGGDRVVDDDDVAVEVDVGGFVPALAAVGVADHEA